MALHSETSEPVIVVGVDASPSSLDALRWAADQALLTGSRLHVISCWETLETYSLDEADIPNSVFEEQARKRLNVSLTDGLGKSHASIPTEAIVVRGYPAEVLIEASRTAVLLVIGSRGHGGFVGMLLGSVSHHCVAHAHCPVVVVRHEGHPA